MKVIITTPEGTKFDQEDIELVSLPTAAGELGIKDDHVPLVSVITAGEIEIRRESGETEYIAVSGGILNVEVESVVRILADTAETATEIDLDRAKEARERAEQFLAETDVTDFANVQLLQAKIEKELARERIGNRYRNVGKQS